QVNSLMELCAQAVAIHIPFEQVEEVYKLVPENVQLRIAFWSFPNEEDIRLYSCLANGSPDEFLRGEQLVRGKCVRNVLQIGFHLCANVVPPYTSHPQNPCAVAVMFDRRRITSCSCNCGSSAKWCAHVVALCLIRIQQPLSVCMRAPVSESLSRLRRDQLQKFAQYLISELPQQILPTAQRLLDELLSSQSTVINRLSGAPDPTAGPSMSDKSLWFLDENALNDNIKKALVKFCGPTPIVYSDVNSLYLSSTEPPAAAEYSSLLRPLRGREPEGIWNLLSIVREMLKRRDSNAIPLLDIVTDQCLAFEQVAVWWYNMKTSSSYLQSGSGNHSNSHRPSNNISSEIAQHAAASMCDEIVSLWRLVILDPGSNSDTRKNELKARLSHFHDKTLEIIKRGKYKEGHLQLFEGFKPAIEFCNFDWEAVSISLCSHIVNKKSQPKTKATHTKTSNESSKAEDDMVVKNGESVHCFKVSMVISIDPCNFLPVLKPNQPVKISVSQTQPLPSTERSRSMFLPVVIAAIEQQLWDEEDQQDVLLVHAEARQRHQLVIIKHYLTLKHFKCFFFKSTIINFNYCTKLFILPVLAMKCLAKDNQMKYVAITTDAGTWEESPVDFTSDEGSSVCSPVQFTMSSEDDEQTNHRQNGSTLCASLFLNVDKLPPQVEKAGGNKNTFSKNHIIFGLSQEPNTQHYHSTAQHGGSSIVQMKTTQVETVGNEGHELNHYRQELDALFTRTESLYTHGRSREACELAVKLAEEILARPDELIKEPPALLNNKKAWIRLSTSYACKSLERALFLCNVLLEHQRHHALAFRVGLQGLELKRLPASSKALEVKLFYQQGELANLMKRLPLGPREVSKLCEKENALTSVDTSHEFQHILPLMLTTFIFDAFCQIGRLLQKCFKWQIINIPGPNAPNARSSVPTSRRDVVAPNQELGFAAAVAALGFKLNVSEAEHPLLCEGTRKQKGELALQMLLLYKDQCHKLRMILDSLLDKSLSPNLRASSAFPSCSTVVAQRGQTHPDASVSNVGRGVDRSCQNRRRPGSSGQTITLRLPPCAAPLVATPNYHGGPRPFVPSASNTEAMLSDTSPRLRRRNLNVSQYPNHAGAAPGGSGWGAQRYPSSPSSDSVESAGTSSSENRRNRGKNSTTVPDVPNQPSEAAAHFFFELAKNVLVKAGGNSSTSLFMQQPQGNSQSGVHRNLVLAAFEIGLYALGLHNCVSPNWLSRTYSSHVSWITGQAMEIGSAALHILVDSWEGHLTPPETASLADRASRGRDSTTVRRAAELALSVLPHAHALNPNEIQRALLQCREQGAPMLEKACHAVEQAGRGGGVYPEVLFDVARQWEWIHRTVIHVNEVARPAANNIPVSSNNSIAAAPAASQYSTSKPSFLNDAISITFSGIPFLMYILRNAKQFLCQTYKLLSLPAQKHPYTNNSCTTAIPMANLPPHTVAHNVSGQSIPVSVSGVVLPGGGVITIQVHQHATTHFLMSQSVILIPSICHPASLFRGFAPTLMDPQLSGVNAGIPQMPHYAAVHIHPAPAINLVSFPMMKHPGKHTHPHVPMPASNLHALQYHPSRGPFLHDPHHHHHQLHHQNTPQLPIPGINMHANPLSTQIFSLAKTKIFQLQSAFRVGMLAMDLLTKRTEDRPNNKYARNPPYASDVKWLLKLSVKLGVQYVQQFCLTAVGGVSSPFVLQDIALETAKYLSENNNQQVTLFVFPFLHPILSKCLQMYVQFIHNRLYHIHHTSDHDDFVALVHTARSAFCMSPGGLLQFNEVLQSIRRSKACKNELWQKINTSLSL
uniref:SWIM-type domain-containing protein n=1 Tax=Ciona savignyi TaxID=51511 RepID=H2Y5Y3_CIOSA